MDKHTRRAFLKSLSASGAGAYLLTRRNLAFGGTKKESEVVKNGKAPFKVLYNNDTTNVNCVSPWHKKGEPFREEMLAASIDEVDGIDAYFLSPGVGWIPWWPSKVYPDHYQWWMKKTGLKPDAWGEYFLNGGDIIKILIDRCKARDMSPFVSYRLNDCHMLEFAGTKHPGSAAVPRFYVEHPEYMFDPDHVKKKPAGYSGRRAQNWAIQEVRDYKFALIEEVCTNYDLAGLELDFLRDSHLFRQNETSEEQRVELITGFVSKIRKMLDQTERSGQRRYLCVRIPVEIAAHGAIGLDVRKLADEGVDMFNLSGWYQTNQRTDIAQVRKIVPEAAIYLEMTHSTGAHSILGAGSNYGTAGFPRTSDEQLYTTAHLAYERGADGISLFNFVYYRDHGTAGLAPINEPPFHVLPRLSDPEWLAQQPQYYWLGPWRYYRQVYRHILPQKSETFQFDLAPPREAKSEDGRLRIHTKKPFGEAELVVTMNGVELSPTDDRTAYYGNPYDGMISDLPRRRAWTCPVGILRDGLNKVEVTVTSTSRIRVIFIDLAVE